jgi:BirA family transcriptional regulator, biotin operon repressor / biotin---[acetyl-CoA-carboxylase] ligase
LCVSKNKSINNLYNILAKTLFIGQNVIQLESCFSTNEALKQLIVAGNIPEGTLLLTTNQTNGKGQLGNKWFSEPFKNMTFSLYLKPNYLKLENSFDLSVLSSLAIYDFLAHFQLDNLKIKWPNDMYVAKKKIAGILIENTVSSDFISGSIIGIGININQLFFDEIANKTTSLSLCKGIDYNIADMYVSFLSCFEKRYLQYKSKGIEVLKPEYLSKMLFYQEKASFIINNEEVYANLIGINKQGLLALEIGNELKYYDLKEVKFVI